jgi:predicted small lipoprotein YifL
MRRDEISILVALTMVVALIAGCGGKGAGSPAPAPASTAATASAAPSAPVTSVPTVRPSTIGPTWSSGPVTVVRHPAVPPVPVVVRVRAAAHPAEGFDRIVFDIDGAAPGYSVRYVDQVKADPSDRPVAVPGRRHLLVVLTPAQAHRDDSAVTISGVHRLGLPMMRSYAVVGDYEGYVSIAIGVDDVVGYRVGELPGRIYLDVAA